MTTAQPLVLMMAGGTGGHVYPALAVARELLERGFRVEWVGTRRGLEQRVVPAAGIKLHHLSVRGVRGKGMMDKLAAIFSLALSSIQALWLVLRVRPGCVVGMGGYAAGPAGVAAWLMRRPLVIHEQNAVAGTTNRLLAPMAKKVIPGFPDAFVSEIPFEVLGNPVRREMIEAAAIDDYDYNGQRPLRLLVLGGSLGARPINDVLPAAVRALKADSATAQLDVWHQTGEAHAQLVTESYGDLCPGAVRVMPFIEDMASAYRWADLVLCRAGALTVAELAIMGRPSILVPLPHAIDDHQTANARSLSDRGGAILLRQSDLSESALVDAIRAYVEFPSRLQAMAVAASAAGEPQATVRVADCCQELLHGQ